MPRPSLRALAFFVSVSSCLTLAIPAQAGQMTAAGGAIATAGGGAVSGRQILPYFPHAVSGRVLPSRVFHHGGHFDHTGAGIDPIAYRELVTGDFRYGRFYDALLTRLYGPQTGFASYQGPAIITLGGGNAAYGAGDPPVLAAPPEASAAPHGVRVIYLTDPPAQYQQRADAEPRARRRHRSY